MWGTDMNFLSKALFLTLGLSLAACTNPDRFGTDDTVNLNGNGAAVAGSASDPTSPLYFQQTVGDRVLFEVDQATLNAGARSVLDGQAAWLLTNSDYAAVIEGHADEQGTREYNLALGARRAEAAREYLVSKGIAASRLKVLSYGKERPIEICSAEACYAKNRRAVTILSSGLSS